jgi:cysteine desulfurase
MKRIYLDHASGTPLHPKALEAMLPYLQGEFGNPSSLHSFGQKAKAALEEARSRVAELINAHADEIIFTSSGTESDNFALKGIALRYQEKGKHIISSPGEHYAVLHSLKTLEKWGFKVTLVPVDKHGLVDPQEISRAMTDETILISIMHANNEVGTIEPIAEIGKIARERGVVFHCDAVASAGTIPVDVVEMGVNALALSAYQFYGPKGVGAMFLKKGTRITPLLNGGIQEEGRRPGIENVAGIVGMGVAAELAKNEMEERMRHLISLRDKIIVELPKRIDHLYLNGHPQKRLPNNVNVSIEYVEGESMLLFLDQKGIAAASGSACTSRALKSSHVLTAIGVDPAIAQGSLVFSLGIDNTEEDVNFLLESLPPIVERLRQMSPLYKQ